MENIRLSSNLEQNSLNPKLNLYELSIPEINNDKYSGVRNEIYQLLYEEFELDILADEIDEKYRKLIDGIQKEVNKLKGLKDEDSVEKRNKLEKQIEFFEDSENKEIEDIDKKLAMFFSDLDNYYINPKNIAKIKVCDYKIKTPFGKIISKTRLHSFYYKYSENYEEKTEEVVEEIKKENKLKNLKQSGNSNNAEKTTNYYYFDFNQFGKEKYSEYYERVRLYGAKRPTGLSYTPYGLTVNKEKQVVFKKYKTKEMKQCTGNPFDEKEYKDSVSMFNFDTIDEYLEYKETAIIEKNKEKEKKLKEKEFIRIAKEKLRAEERKNKEEVKRKAQEEVQKKIQLAQERVQTLIQQAKINQKRKLEECYAEIASRHHINNLRNIYLPERIADLPKSKIKQRIGSSMTVKPVIDLFKNVLETDNYEKQRKNIIEFEDIRDFDTVYISKSEVLKHISYTVSLDDKIKGVRSRTRNLVNKLRRKIKDIGENIYKYKPYLLTGEVVRDVSLPVYRVRKEYIFDKYYHCYAAATFFQMLVSFTPIDEKYKFSRKYYSDSVRIGTAIENIENKFRVNKKGEIITKEIKEPEVRLKTVIKKYVHEPDEVKVRADWILTICGVNFKAFKSKQGQGNKSIPSGAEQNTFNEEDFIYTGDKEAISRIAGKIFEKIKDIDTDDFTFTYTNINPRWEILEKGGYEKDTENADGSRFSIGLSKYGFKHGVKGNFTYMAPNGFIAVAESFYKDQVKRNRGYITRFVNNYVSRMPIITNPNDPVILRLMKKYPEAGIGSKEFTDNELFKIISERSKA